MKPHEHTAEQVAKTIIEDIQEDPNLLACRSFPELHDHCDANTLGCQEAVVEELGLENALSILNAAQQEVNLWLVANAIECHPHWDSIDMNVESHSAAFKVKYGRYPNVEADGDACNELFFDPIFLKIRALVKERTGK